MEWKNWIIIGICFLLVGTIAFFTFHFEWYTMVYHGIPNKIEPRIDKQLELNDTSLIVNGKTLEFFHNDKYLNITIWARIDGDITDVKNNVDWWKEKRDNSWKFGANMTIPNQNVADNLEEVIFQIQSNVPIDKLKRGFKQGFETLDSCEEEGFVKKCTYITYDFRDIFEVAFNRTAGFEYGKRNDYYYIAFDVRNINFTSGQVVELDPTVTLDDVDSYDSIKNNVTTEAYPMSHNILDDDDLVLYYSSDLQNYSSTVYDYSAYGNDGVLDGNITWLSKGYIGGGYEFKNDEDDIDVPYDDTINSTSITLLFWARSFTNTSSGVMTLFEFGDSSLTYTQVEASASSAGSVTVRWLDGNGATGSDYCYQCITNISKWTHYVFVFNDTGGNLNMTLYENAVAKKSVLDADGMGYNDLSHIGSRGSAAANWRFNFNGTIDEFMMFNRSLSEAEITNIYNNQSARFVIPATQTFRSVDIQQNGSLYGINLTTNSTQNFGTGLQARLWEWNGTSYNTSQEALSDGIYAWYNLDSNINDVMGLHNGTITGTVTQREGYYNDSRWFQGSNDYITIGKEGNFSDVCVSGCTFTAWINHTGDSSQREIIGRHDSSGSNLFFDLYTISDELVFEIYEDGGFLDSPCQATSTGDAISGVQNNWHHVVGKYNGSDTFVYYDSSLLDSTTCSFTINENAWQDDEDTFIGLFDDSSFGGDWNGEIDEVIIWNRSLSADEIEELYYKGRLKYETNNPEYKTINNGNNNQTWFNISDTTDMINIEFNYTTDSNNFYSPILHDNIDVESWVGIPPDAPAADPEYPLFSNFWDTNSTNQSIIAYFNATVTHTNGTVQLDIDNTNYTATNLTATVFNVSLNLTSSGTFAYYWNAWGNGTSNNYNVSDVRYYTVDEVSAVDTCTYSSGTWNIECWQNCSITSNVSIDAGGNISMNGSGTFIINDGVRISGWTERHTKDECYYFSRGIGGFYS